MSDQARQEFEKWISSPPYDECITRYPKDERLYLWPGSYREDNVQLAWEAWIEAWNRSTGEGDE